MASGRSISSIQVTSVDALAMADSRTAVRTASGRFSCAAFSSAAAKRTHRGDGQISHGRVAARFWQMLHLPSSLSQHCALLRTVP